MNFTILADQNVNIKENAMRINYFDLARELKKLWNMKVTVFTNCNWCVWNDPSRLDKWGGAERDGNQRTDRDRPNDNTKE